MNIFRLKRSKLQLLPLYVGTLKAFLSKYRNSLSAWKDVPTAYTALYTRQPVGADKLGQTVYEIHASHFPSRSFKGKRSPENLKNTSDFASDRSKYPFDLPKLYYFFLFNRTITHEPALYSRLIHHIYIYTVAELKRRIALESFLAHFSLVRYWITVTTNRWEMENRAYGRYVASGKRQINRVERKREKKRVGRRGGKLRAL